MSCERRCTVKPVLATVEPVPHAGCVSKGILGLTQLLASEVPAELQSDFNTVRYWLLPTCFESFDRFRADAE